MNELLSNSIKHAFPSKIVGERKEKNTIRVVMKRTDHKNQFIVEDNGVGFTAPSRFYNAESMGLQLITALAEQLGGDKGGDNR